MKVRANRKGLLGLVVHEKGDEFEIDQSEFYPYWMDAVDEESKDVEQHMLRNAKNARAEKLRKEAAKLQARAAELEPDLPQKEVRGTAEEVL